VAEAARRHKVNVSALSMQFRGPAQSNGLLLGFAAVDEKAMRKGLAKLREAMQECLKKR
jgi:DNA-binding transcriptional MocR family regulator